MTSSVLYDVPGPRTQVRYRLYGLVATMLIVIILAYAGRELWEADQITPEAWRFLTRVDIVLALAKGLGATLSAAAVAIILAVGFGAMFAVGQLSDHLWVRWPSVAVVQFFRAIPVLLLILFLFLSMGGTLETYWSLVVALMLYNGSVLAEIFRSGILAVPKGQKEAAYAIGLRKGQVLGIIQIPQAITTMLPAIISQCVIALKDTALGFAIGASEITRTAGQIYKSPEFNNPIAVGLLLLAIFVAINYSLARLARWLEYRMRQDDRAMRSTKR